MPELIDPGQSTWGAHRHDTLGKCFRLYGYSYVEEAPRETTEPQMLGTLVHLALAHRYMEMQCEQNGEPNPYYAPLEAVTAKTAALAEEGEDWRYLEGRVADFFRQYEWEYQTADRGWRVLAIEKELKMRLADGEDSYLFTQRADLIFRSERTGLVYIVDHKTAARASVARTFEVSLQMVGYQVFGQGFWGDRFGGVLLNMLQKPKQDGKWQFTRPMLNGSPGMVRAFKASMLHRRRALAELEAADIPVSDWPMAISDSICWTKYGACPYNQRCHTDSDPVPRGSRIL